MCAPLTLNVWILDCNGVYFPCYESVIDKINILGLFFRGKVSFTCEDYFHNYGHIKKTVFSS
jgi:hypothetical protein